MGKMTASPAQLLVLASVRIVVLDTRFGVSPASRQARQVGTMGRLDATVTPEGSSTSLPSGWKIRRMLCGNIVWWSMMGKK